VSCRQWSNESKKIEDFMEKIESHPAFNKLTMVNVVKPIKFIESPKACYMVMKRIFRPDKKIAPTLQAQLGCESGRMVHKGRGEFIGLKEIREYIMNEDINKASKELGILMGLIHFVGKNDAYDVELYLGKEKYSKKCKLYLADFDLSESITEYNNETINRIRWSLDAVPYFPRLSADKELFDEFLKGYKQIAENDELVDEIFSEYD
jgi:tRNA A-37 threonylcarbamoyl transferase component Bud32